MDKFKIGDVVYVATYGNRQIQVVCPVCFGKLEVTLILGDDSHVRLPCRYCAIGYDPPRGTVSEWVDVANVDVRIITAIHTEESDGTCELRYSCDGFGSDSDNTFATEAEATEYGAKLAKERKEELTTNAKYLKEENHKSYSWNAGYHRRTAKKHRKDAEYHDEKAVLCKERAK